MLVTVLKGSWTVTIIRARCGLSRRLINVFIAGIKSDAWAQGNIVFFSVRKIITEFVFSRLKTVTISRTVFDWFLKKNVLSNEKVICNLNSW